MGMACMGASGAADEIPFGPGLFPMGRRCQEQVFALTRDWWSRFVSCIEKRNWRAPRLSLCDQRHDTRDEHSWRQFPPALRSLPTLPALWHRLRSRHRAVLRLPVQMRTNRLAELPNGTIQSAIGLE